MKIIDRLLTKLLKQIENDSSSFPDLEEKYCACNVMRDLKVNILQYPSAAF